MNSNIFEIQIALDQGNVVVEKLLWEENCLYLTVKNVNSLKRISIKFFYVMDAEIHAGPYENFQLSGLQVENISNYQMVNKNFRVCSENGQCYLFFYCESFQLIESF